MLLSTFIDENDERTSKAVPLDYIVLYGTPKNWYNPKEQQSTICLLLMKT